jgi:Txe/YoeB family toxin of Txe-Axe toxin-antitoxin module
LIHDSDGKDANKLHDSLSVSLDASAEAPHVIVIPVQEVEAWLLSDERAVTRALRLKNAVKRLPNPETIGSPKERLAKEIWQKSSRRITYLNTKHNRLIAHEAELAKLRRCPSFLPLDEFINQHL